MNRKARRREGYVLMAGLVILVVVILPAFMFLYKNSQLQINMAQRIMRTRETLEKLRNTIMMDLNQAQTDFYQDHFDRTVGAFALEAVPSRQMKSRYYALSGNNSKPVGQDGAYTTSTNLGYQRIRAVMGFRNDAFRFGLVVQNGLAIDEFNPLNNATFQAGAYIKGPLNLSGATLDINTRPVLVEGNVTGGLNVRLLPGAQLYLSGTLNMNGGQFLGTNYREVPPMDLMEMDLSTFKTKYRSYTDVSALAVKSATWTFTQTGPDCICTYGPGISDFWPVTYQTNFGWPVFVLEGGNLTLSGQCAAKVTVVSYSETPSDLAGNVFIVGDYGQIPGGTLSTSTSTFAVLASRQITFNGGGPLKAYGYYYAQNFEVADNPVSLNPTQVQVYGTLHATLGFLPVSVGNSLKIQFDPDLYINIPPGIPERPHLITYHLRK